MISYNTENYPNRDSLLEKAGNVDLPEMLLWLLAKDEDPEVRREVARNPNCPIESLKILAKDKI